MLIGGIPPVSQMVAVALVMLIGMTVHEFAHCWVADRMGDPTPRSMGRLTLNPFVHIYWPGWLMWVLVGFGILGSAPINPRRMRDPRWGYVAAVAAGPISNLLLAALFAIPIKFDLINLTFGAVNFSRDTFLPTLEQLLYAMVYFNILLFLFNLIPIPGLDGWWIMLELLPRDLKFRLEPYSQYGMPIFILIIMLGIVGFPVISWIIEQPMLFLIRLFLF